MENFNIFEMLYETYKIKNDNPLRVIEFFGGYGSQTLALKYLGVKYEHWKLCEWAVPSIIAYASVHRNELKEYGKNFCKELSKEQIVNFLFKYGVSTDYNKPATLEQIKRIPEEKLRLCYNSIKWANNLVDISRVKGNNLEIANTDKYTYLLTYSFPCQDLSLAGKCAGMEKGSGTRSGLLWEVERILSECENKPQILLMENVTQVHGAGNEEHFKQWLLRLEEMGYQSYWQDLSATEFKIPQTRNRTFMVSILGNYNYTFPKKTKLELRLKDLLEPDGAVDEKFYISDKMINYISKTGANGFNNKDAKINLDIARPLTTDPNKRAGTTNYLSSDFPENFDLSKVHGTKNRAELLLLLLSKNGELEKHDLPNGCDSSLNNPKIREVSNTITTRYDAGIQNQQQIGMCVVEKAKRLGGLYDKNGETHQAGSIYDSDFSSPTLDCSNGGGNRQPFIVEKGEKNKSLKETLEKTDMDEENVGVVIKENLGYTEKSLNKIKKNIVDKNDVSGSLTATGMQSLNHDGCQLVSLKRGYSIEVKEEKKCINCKYTNSSYFGGIPYCIKNFKDLIHELENDKIYFCENYEQKKKINSNLLRIRKLPPKECFRLMGLKDEDIDLVMENQSNSLGYHLAGDSIVTTCMMAIFSKLFDINWLEHFKPKEWWKN